MFTRVRAGLVIVGVLAAVIAGLVWARQNPLPSPRASIDPRQLTANGYDLATLAVDAPGMPRPSVTVATGARSASIVQISATEGGWQAQVRAGVLPGRVTVKVAWPHGPTTSAELLLTADGGDRFEDGTPDYLRLDDEGDRAAFRQWFTFLAEAQYFQRPQERPPEINDCAALIRYAYREALHAHDSAWTAGARLPLVPALASVAKYRYPYTPLGAGLFRVRAGTYRDGDAENGAFTQFADAQTLRRFNTHFVSRELSRALPGDLLFFRQESDHMPFHSMVYLGASQVRPSNETYLLYHTGPDGNDPGELRRLTTGELLRFPRPEWRPVAHNPQFLGVFRWNILRKASNADDASRE